MYFFLSHSFVALAVCFKSLSCWNTHPRPSFNALAGFNALALTVHAVHADTTCSCPVPLAETAPNHNVSNTMFEGRGGVLVVIGSIPPPKTAS